MATEMETKKLRSKWEREGDGGRRGGLLMEFSRHVQEVTGPRAWLSGWRAGSFLPYATGVSFSTVCSGHLR